MKLIKQLNEEAMIEEAIDNAIERDVENGDMDDLIAEALKEYEEGTVVE
jgi:hypothetical protein